MNKRFEISIPKSCSENWAAMSQAEGGNYCSSCSKKVIDFTDFSEKALQEWFLMHQDEKICGRFLKTQLDQREYPPKVNTWTRLSTRIFAASMLIFPFTMKAASNSPVQKQTITAAPVNECTSIRTAEKQPQPADSLRTIKGIVIDKNTRECLRGAEVTIKGTRIRSFADSTGNFQISFNKDVKPVLVIVYLGYKTFEQEAGMSDKFTALMSTEDTSKLMGEVCIVKRPSLFKRIIRPIKRSL